MRFAAALMTSVIVAVTGATVDQIVASPMRIPAHQPKTAPSARQGDSAQASDLCKTQSTTDPAQLNGQVRQSNYSFTHASDVDRFGSLRRYTSSIQNERQDAYLPAEWIRSDRTVELAFDRIAPGGCGANQVETSLPEKEDPIAVINYGPTKSLQQKAPLYTQANTGSDEAAQVGQKLTSSIVADIVDREGARRALRLTFTTQFEGNHAQYVVSSQSDSEVLFTIPDFVRAWNQVKGEPTEKWEIRDDQFAVKPKGSDTQVVQVPAGARLRERVVTFLVWSRDKTEVAKGRVALYLPEPVGER